MRNKDIKQLLRNADDGNITQISKDYPGMTAEESARVYERILQSMQDTPEILPQPDEPTPAAEAPRFAWLSHALTAAACLAVCGGTLAGLFWLNAHAPVQPEDTGSSAQTELAPIDPAHSIGERYAAANLIASGTLYVTVDSAVQEGELIRVELTLESEGAVSLAKAAMGEPYLFFADNFQAAADSGFLPPCQVETDAAGVLPNTFVLRPGDTCRLTLWYALGSETTCRLTTGTAPDMPYTIIDLEE